MRIVEEPADSLEGYGVVPIAFEVRSRLRVEPMNQGLEGIRLVREVVDPTYIRNYDENGGPIRWFRRWDLQNWGVLAAFDGSVRVGGAVIAWRTQGVNMLDGRDDLAVLWDLRVHPKHRGQGIGQRLFHEALDWAKVRQCLELKVETQNTNVPACAFYVSQGCELAAINSFAYVDEPEEIQLLWRYRL